MKNKIIATFNQLCSVYENSIDTKSLNNSEYERPAMMNEIPSNLKNKKVLDAGCAAGWYTEQLIRRGADVVATDISPEMASATKRRIGEKAEVLCLDLEEKLPFEDNYFDYIISSLTLHYLKEWNDTFSELKRILKPNGTLLFSVHHPFTDVKLLQDYRYFSTEQITDQWKKEGKLYDVPFYRRPLQYILNTTVQFFTIEKVIEPQPTARLKELAPEKHEYLLNNPQFLIIKCKKGE